MFNKTKDKALSSKVEETLKLITDDRKNRFYLLKLARERCKYKVVVKNLRSSYSIIDVNPDYSIKTKLLRYDVFLGKNESTEEDF